ncbi:hypothetical protein [Streptomyces sp. NPDC004296]|uniref:hypothetical protein n=1 Tax=Streptomyces sp. NPDC004296 TaxID=3364697 RepID=UPI003683AB6A
MRLFDNDAEVVAELLEVPAEELEREAKPVTAARAKEVIAELRAVQGARVPVVRAHPGQRDRSLRNRRSTARPRLRRLRDALMPRDGDFRSGCSRWTRWAAPGPTVGRPKGSGDMVPSDQLAGRITELLDADPAVTAATVVEHLGIATTTAMAGLAQLRGQRMAALVEAAPELSLDAAADQLGYPVGARRRATAAAQDEQRRNRVRPYLQNVTDDLAQAGLADAGDVKIRQLGEHLAAAVVLRPGQPAPALVWHEQYGWRTAISRRHPIGKVSAPEGEGIRYLSGELQPKASVLIDALADGRRGRKRP